jgi:anti-sigma B factor antagonist
MDNLSVEKKVIDKGTVTLVLKGFIDSTNASLLSEVLEGCIAKNQFSIILDFKEIEYVSSAGWGVLISKIRDIREKKGDILLTGMVEGVNSIYKLMELNLVFKSFRSVKDALSVLKEEVVELEVQEERKEEISAEPEKVRYLEEVTVREKKKVRSIEDEIRAIIAENPLISLRELPRELSKKEHGEWRIGWFQLRKLLGEMQLGTLVQRLYYAFLKAKGRL